MAIHLHLHTSGSELDGACDIEKVVDKVISQGENAVAITDHGNMIKAYEFYKTCKSKNIKPIIGCEFYCGEKEDTNKYHLVLLAKNNTGLKNLYKLVHKSYELFHSKPRISLKALEEHKDGLICLTACIGGELAKHFMNNRVNEAISFASYLKVLFGDDLYLEIQPNAQDEQYKYNVWIQKICKELKFKPVVTCDCHYVNKEDSESHDTLLCMQVIKKKDDVKRFRFPTKDAYLKTNQEITSNLHYLSGEFVGDCLDNTYEIADKCNVTIEKENLMPDLPGIDDPDKALADLCNIGFQKRYKQGAYNGLDISLVVKRISYELSVLKDKGFSGYFLILEDFYRFAKDNKIPTGVGRGSCCGSEVAYLLGLTEVEPIKYGLLFERFLNPTRNSDPDFDADICYEKRGEVIQYIKNKYGENNTSHIMAEGSLTLKNVMRRVLSAYGYEIPVINAYSKLVPDKCGTLKEALELSTDLSEKLKGQPLKDMLALEGLMSHASKHAAGVLIMNDRVDNHFPVRVDREENIEVCEWHKKHVESLGAVKFDLLGLKQLTIFDKTLKAIKKNHNIDISLSDLYNIDFEDKKIYEVLNSGKLSTIFQFTGHSASAIVNQIKPQCFEDIMVAESICRPGVKEADLYLTNKKYYDESQDFPKPSYWEYVKDILEPTYGALVYQEQTMLIMNKIAGWDLGKADGMRKVKNLEEFRDDFNKCSSDNGYDINVSNDIFSRFDLGYSFNKSHACAYGKISAMCAYLYAYYPCEFIASSLTLELTQAEPNIEGILKEAKSLGISILPSDINLSTSEFESFKDGIRIPLTSISFIGDSAYKEILKNKPYNSFNQFITVVPKAKVKKTAVINLIKAGAFDDIHGTNRSELLEYYYKLRGDEPKDCFFWCDDVQIMYERQVYGFSIGKHPLDGYTNRDISEFKDGDVVNIIGIISKATIRKDKKNNDMAFLEMENKECRFRGLVFSFSYSKVKQYCKDGLKVSVSGKKDGNSILINNINLI